MPRGLGRTQKKILVFLLGGVTFGLTRNPKKQWTIIKEIPYALQDIDRHNSLRSALTLRERGLITFRKNSVGVVEPVLTKKGKREAAKYALHETPTLRKEKWDGKWRLVVFDVPERERWKRDAIRYHLQEIGFYEVQRSTFVFPYECRDTIDKIVRLVECEDYVRYGELSRFDDKDLRKVFRL
jgi:DNA-binding transcriptional regulator PaaX